MLYFEGVSKGIVGQVEYHVMRDPGMNRLVYYVQHPEDMSSDFII